eukprot:19759-Eustigmatos_ZCMA.PRE.1
MNIGHKTLTVWTDRRIWSCGLTAARISACMDPTAPPGHRAAAGSGDTGGRPGTAAPWHRMPRHRRAQADRGYAEAVERQTSQTSTPASPAM